jgi:filamentous hemagglutinin
VPDLYLRGRRARAGDPRLSPISLEAKNYYLGDAAVYDEFLSATAKQATQRAAALPKSAQQHVVIDLRGQNPPPGFLDRLRNDLAERSGGVLKPDRIHFLTSGAE